MNTKKRKEPLPDPKTISTNNKKTKLLVANNDDPLFDIFKSIFIRHLILDDVNCLYCSILYCLVRDDTSYNDLRQYICDHMEEKGLKYSLFVGDNFKNIYQNYQNLHKQINKLPEKEMKINNVENIKAKKYLS